MTAASEGARPPTALPGIALGRTLGAGAQAWILEGVTAGGDEVAVKVSRDPADSPRVARAAAVLRRVSHPGLIRLLRAAPDHEPPYLVFPRLAGGTLRDLLARGPLPLDEVRALGVRVAGALDALHAAGVLHRDVKPSNIFLDASGRAVLGDLGLARPPDATTLTRTGHVVGTLGYLAPEIYAGLRPGPPADVFALGLVLAEAVDGAAPAVSNEGHLLAPGAIAGGAPRALADAIRKALRADPGSRATAAELAAALAAAGTAEGGDAATRTLTADHAPPPPSPVRALPRPRARAPGSGALLLASGLVLLALLAHPPAPAAAPDLVPAAAASPAETRELDDLVAAARPLVLDPLPPFSNRKPVEQLLAAGFLDPRTPLRWRRFLQAFETWIGAAYGREAPDPRARAVTLRRFGWDVGVHWLRAATSIVDRLDQPFLHDRSALEAATRRADLDVAAVRSRAETYRVLALEVLAGLPPPARAAPEVGLLELTWLRDCEEEIPPASLFAAADRFLPRAAGHPLEREIYLALLYPLRDHAAPDLGSCAARRRLASRVLGTALASGTGFESGFRTVVRNAYRDIANRHPCSYPERFRGGDPRELLARWGAR